MMTTPFIKKSAEFVICMSLFVLLTLSSMTSYAGSATTIDVGGGIEVIITSPVDNSVVRTQTIPDPYQTNGGYH